MQKKTFYNLLQGDGIQENNLELQNCTERYPYFNSAHLLLAKSLYEKEDTHFLPALKRAAIYAGDRELLYYHIYKPVTENKDLKTFIEEKEAEHALPVQEEISEVPSTLLVTPISSAPEINNQEDTSKKVTEINALVSEDIKRLEKLLNEIKSELSQLAESPVEMNPVTVLPEKVIPGATLQSLQNEIAAIKSETLPPVTKTVSEIGAEPKREEPKFIPDLVEPVKPRIIPDLKPEEEQDRGAKVLETNSNIKETIQPDENLSFKEWLNYIRLGKPLPEKQPKAEVEEKTEITSNTQISTPEVVKEEKENSGKKKSQMDLINRFIAEEPRIVPQKATFYSPPEKARQSVAEDDELVTETLARVYEIQGNYKKAIKSYEILSLKFPEKSAYFATLIEKCKQNLISK